MSDARVQIDRRQRFAFGENWARFLELIDDERIRAAEDSLRERLGDLTGRTFLDVGCGSGLFSLAARNLGAHVVSFDYDPQSVACAVELRRRYRPDDDDWRIEQGSALDRDYLRSLGQFDVLYSWGVLHHTGDMWAALANVAESVALNGKLFISIYNDQGRSSRIWRRVKQRYVSSGPAGQKAIELAVRARLRSAGALWRLAGALWRSAKRARPRQGAAPRARGMDAQRDLIDWIGGYPFEVAKPEEIFEYMRDHGFRLDQLKTCGGGLGCNEYVFSRQP